MYKEIKSSTTWKLIKSINKGWSTDLKYYIETNKKIYSFYEYSDDETVDLVYNQIVYLTAPELENVERENYETTLSDGDRVFTILIDDVYYLVMYRNDTVVYAYSPDSLNEIKEILTGIGYLKN